MGGLHLPAETLQATDHTFEPLNVFSTPCSSLSIIANAVPKVVRTAKDKFFSARTTIYGSQVAVTGLKGSNCLNFGHTNQRNGRLRDHRLLNRLEYRLGKNRRIVMLWTIVIILLVLWALGFGVAGAAVGNLIHILLVIAVIVVVIQLVTGRRGV